MIEDTKRKRAGILNPPLVWKYRIIRDKSHRKIEGIFSTG